MLKKYRVDFYRYTASGGTNFIEDRIFKSNTTIIINLSSTIFFPTILNNIFTMIPLQRLKIKGGYNEIDETTYNINVSRGVNIITKSYIK
jgi:hypothetical protein